MRERTKWLFEFSKRVVQVMISLYVCHIVFSDLLLLIKEDLSSLGQITESLTQVVIVCLGGYLFKAALENVFKIRGNNNDEYN